jgi:hypothetical protein
MKDFKFAFQAVEKMSFLPGGYHHLVFIDNKILVLYLAATSPGQTERWTGGKRGLAGAVGKQVGKAVASSKQSKLEKKISDLHKLSEEEALAQSKHNYSIPYSSIKFIEVKSSMEEGGRKLFVHLNDKSGPFLSRSKRKFMIEMPTDEEADELLNELKEKSPVKVVSR